MTDECEHNWDFPAEECECGDGHCLVVCTECGETDRACEDN